MECRFYKSAVNYTMQKRQRRYRQADESRRKATSATVKGSLSSLMADWEYIIPQARRTTI
ncbi:MAG: hypothetical protein SPI30_07680 [Prevotella sp.]|nr:hypothetical protein [Prevotella sp.]